MEETSRSRGVISQESPEPGYIVVSLTMLAPNPIPAPSTFFSLEISPHFSHPHGICRHISTTLGLNSCTIEHWYLSFFKHNFALLEVPYVLSERMISFEERPMRVKGGIFFTRF